MKITYKFYTIILCAILGFSGCKKALDLKPENNLVLSSLLNDRVTVDRFLAGGFYNQYLTEKNGYPVADLSAGIAQALSNPVYTGAMDASYLPAYTIWTGHYNVINTANTLISNLSKYAQFDVSYQKQYIAEAKFLRAFSYFRLAILFGDDIFTAGSSAKLAVPLRLIPFENYEQADIIPRASNQDILNQVIKDLEEAIPDLPLSFPDGSNPAIKLRSRAVKSVGQAFLSRVYLYIGQYQKSIDMANPVLADPTYVLADNPLALYPVNLATATVPLNSEMVYGYPVTWNSYITTSTGHQFGYVNGNIYLDPDFVASFAATDLRRTTLIANLSVSGVPRFISKKYTSTINSTFDNVYVIRLAEVMLNKAEAQAQLTGVNQTSIDLLNAIYQRAFAAGTKPALYTTASFSSKGALVQRILKERSWELAFEGHERYDRLRSGLAINPVLPIGKYAFPIPQLEISLTDGVIVQNPGYIN